MLTLNDVLTASIEAVRFYQPEGDPYFGAFSGGKDSVCLKEVARLAGANVVWHYSNVTIDPPELVRFIREVHPDVTWDQPRHGGFFAQMRKRGFPTRIVRWCCSEFKESRTPKGARLLAGMRAAESPRRAKAWKVFTLHRRTGDAVVSPLYHWTDDHVWEFIRGRNIPYCKLYDEGFKRLGCIGCPMAGSKGRKAEFARWPKYEAAWKKGFEAIWERRAGTKQRDGREWFGSARFPNWQAMWEWWLNGDRLPPAPCQGVLDIWSTEEEP